MKVVATRWATCRGVQSDGPGRTTVRSRRCRTARIHRLRLAHVPAALAPTTGQGLTRRLTCAAAILARPYSANAQAMAGAEKSHPGSRPSGPTVMTA